MGRSVDINWFWSRERYKRFIEIVIENCFVGEFREALKFCVDVVTHLLLSEINLNVVLRYIKVLLLYTKCYSPRIALCSAITKLLCNHKIMWQLFFKLFAFKTTIRYKWNFSYYNKTLESKRHEALSKTCIAVISDKLIPL